MITITTPGEPKLATAAELKVVLPSLTDEVAENLLAQASAMIAQMCNRVLHRQTVSEVTRMVCSQKLEVSRFPIDVIANIEVDGETLAASDYEHDGVDIYRLSNDVREPWNADKVTVTYDGGYPSDGIPADLKRACLDLCVNLHSTEGRDLTLRGTNIPGVESVSYRDPSKGGGLVPDHVEKVIDSYRIFPV